MKVLLVHNFYQSKTIGGEDCVFKRELASLKQHLGDSNVFSYTVSNDNVKKCNLLFGIWGNWRHYFMIKKLIKQNSINLIHVHNTFPMLTPLVFMAGNKAGAKVVHTLHNFREFCISGILFQDNKICEKCVYRTFGLHGVIKRCYRGSLIQSILAAMATAFYKIVNYHKYIDYYFALSPFQVNKLQQFKLPTNKILYKPNPIEPVAASSIDNKQNYLYIGRLERAKGIWDLCEAWAKLDNSFKLTVIGTGIDEDSLKQKYSQHNINFIGQVPQSDLAEYISAAKYLIHPSLVYETFGLTMLEAMAYSTPVIGFNIGTRNDFIQHGVNGFLAPQDQLVKTIEMAENHPDYAKLSNNAYTSSTAFFKDNVIQQQLALYKDICEQQI